jgi:hypothetical protein
VRKRNCYLSSWYWKLKQRRGAKKAIIALARKVLIIIYNMLKTGSHYDETIFETVRQKQSERLKKRLMVEARKLGFEIVQPSKPA